MKPSFKKILVVLVVCLALISFAALFLLKLGSKPGDLGSGVAKDGKATLKVVPEKADAVVGDVIALQARYDPDGPAGKEPEIDVTRKTEWQSGDAKMAKVVNEIAELKGQMTTHQEGITTISASYSGLNFSVPVKLTLRPLAIECQPSSRKVKAGEEVTWRILFTQGGTPSYDYEWSGTDGLVGEPGVAIVKKAYQSAGTKNAHVKVTDYAGKVAEADCLSLTVE